MEKKLRQIENLKVKIYLITIVLYLIKYKL